MKKGIDQWQTAFKRVLNGTCPILSFASLAGSSNQNSPLRIIRLWTPSSNQLSLNPTKSDQQKNDFFKLSGQPLASPSARKPSRRELEPIGCSMFDVRCSMFPTGSSPIRQNTSCPPAALGLNSRTHELVPSSFWKNFLRRLRHFSGRKPPRRRRVAEARPQTGVSQTEFLAPARND